MWGTLYVWCVVELLVIVLVSVVASIGCGVLSPQFGLVPPWLVLTVSVMRPSLRQHYQSTLMAWFEGRSQARAAAAVAGLIGSCSEDEVVRLASSRFRDVELAALCCQDLANNVADPTLYAKSSQTCLTECDAFISHSWHDDADAKWMALQLWRQKFVAEHGREPRVWLDKYCIDQNSIETDLRCLPVFLAGCRKVVVFCGPTYLCRLWCIIELFTFVHMGGKVENLELEILLRQGHEQEDLNMVENALDRFDAEQCSCHMAEDKDRMLKIIYSAFGSISAFNVAVRNILHTTRLRDVCVVRSQTLLSKLAVDCVSEDTSCGTSPLSGDTAV